MRLLLLLVASLSLALAAPNTDGVKALVGRRMPQHADSFIFTLENATDAPRTLSNGQQDMYIVANGGDGSIAITGNSVIALTSGLRWYLTTYCHVDIYWFLDPVLDQAPLPLPPVNETYHGTSIVPWRYHFNTVTFSYTSAFWDWNDWELQLDWMALHGINLPLAWVGYEKILIDVFLEAGFTEWEISTFLSGPAFQAWNRFGNIQGSWSVPLPSQWANRQFEMNKQIVARMVELGMTPVLPCFTGFVPQAISRLAPNASFVDGDAWNKFPRKYTNDTFLEPFDPLFATLQKSFITKQQRAYGNVSSIYTLDQYNENDPFSGNLSYLKSVSASTYASLQAADPDAVWMLQGWLFFSSEGFWTDERVNAYLSGVSNDTLDMVYAARLGGNMGLYGQVENVTVNPVLALANESSTMIGMGLTMEGEEGNQVMYDIVLDQAWSSTPLETDTYFYEWVSSRYGPEKVPDTVYASWDILRQTVYNNTDLKIAQAVTKSILELAPNTTGLMNRTGHHPTTIPYDTAKLVEAWSLLYQAVDSSPRLWENEAFNYDLSDLTRQVLANAFNPLYQDFVSSANKSGSAYNATNAQIVGRSMITLLKDLDTVLAASKNGQLSLDAWTQAARSWGLVGLNDTVTNYNPVTNLTTSQIGDVYEYEARNQVTLWGPAGQINDYASKQWAGLVGGYYVQRWNLFIEYTLNSTTSSNGENAGLAQALLSLGEVFDLRKDYTVTTVGALNETLSVVVNDWPQVFS